MLQKGEFLTISTSKELRKGKAMLTTLTSKGQMTLPKAVRDDLNLKPGDKIDDREGRRYATSFAAQPSGN